MSFKTQDVFYTGRNEIVSAVDMIKKLKNKEKNILLIK